MDFRVQDLESTASKFVEFYTPICYIVGFRTLISSTNGHACSPLVAHTFFCMNLESSFDGICDEDEGNDASIQNGPTY